MSSLPQDTVDLLGDAGFSLTKGLCSCPSFLTWLLSPALEVSSRHMEDPEALQGGREGSGI